MPSLALDFGPLLDDPPPPPKGAISRRPPRELQADIPASRAVAQRETQKTAVPRAMLQSSTSVWMSSTRAISVDLVLSPVTAMLWRQALVAISEDGAQAQRCVQATAQHMRTGAMFVILRDPRNIREGMR